MCFGVGKLATTRQTSWTRSITYSYCLGLTGHHHPPQGSHPLSAMPRGWICCSSFFVMPQRMIPSSQDCDLYGLTLSTPWISRDFLNAFLKIVTQNMAPFLGRYQSRHEWHQLRHYSVTWTCVSTWTCLLLWMNTSCEVGVHADPVVLKMVCHHVSALKSCCHNHESRVAYLHLQDRLLYPDWRLFVESGDHKEGYITICSACSSTNEAFFLVVDSLRCWRPKCLAISYTCFFSGQQLCG